VGKPEAWFAVPTERNFGAARFYGWPGEIVTGDQPFAASPADTIVDPVLRRSLRLALNGVAQPGTPDESERLMSSDAPTEVTDNDLQHLYKIIWGDLPLCGCGNPEDGVRLVLELLLLAPFHERTYDEIAALIGTPGAYHLVLGALDSADLIEHGSSINGSWLTSKGRWFLRMAVAAGDSPAALIDKLSGVGFPQHDGTCTDSCWVSGA
jgi:hypothetical protein